jgi:CyaY protein
MSTPILLAESEFHARVDGVLEAIENAAEAAIETAGADIDSEINGGILSLEFTDGSKVIVNRQTPLREIWVAAKSGGFHFRFDGAAWRDTRSGEALDVLLARVITQQSGRVTPITL